MEPARPQDRYRSVIGHFATGVTVVTGIGPQGPAGMTANAMCSLSLDPMLLLVCFDNTSRTLPVVREAGRFAVNVLRADQHELSAIFASKVAEPEKFDGVSFRLVEQVPVIEGALAWLTCNLRELHRGGDHTIGVGAVTGMDEQAGDPLVWYQGAYTTLAPPESRQGLAPGERAPGA